MENEPELNMPEEEMSAFAKEASVKAARGGRGCLMFIFGSLLCLVCIIAGAILFAYYMGVKWDSKREENIASQSFLLDRQKIFEMAFVQQTVITDTASSFPWNVDIPFTDGKLQVGSAQIKVKGIYLIKYGIDQGSIDVWEYYPETHELQISTPRFKVTGIQTIFQELDSENESLLKKLQRAERNQAFKQNREDAAAQADIRIESDEETQKECLEQLKTLLSSFGINLVLVDPIPLG